MSAVVDLERERKGSENKSDKFEFNGNLAFSSKDQMYGKGKCSSSHLIPRVDPSFKDDLISLMYLLIFLQESTLPWSYLNAQGKANDNFQKVR